MISLFGAIAPCLQSALTLFYGLVLQLSRIYDWKKVLFPLAVKVYLYIITQKLSDPKQWIIPPKFQERFCTPTTVISMNLLLGSLAKKKRLKSPNRRSTKTTGSSTSNLVVVYNAFNKSSCTWRGCKKLHKCKGCGSREHRVGNCTKKKWQIDAGGFVDNLLVDNSKTVHIATSIAFNDDLSLSKFMNAFLCLPTFLRPNTTNRFELVDALQPTLFNSSSPLKPSAWAKFLNTYSGPLQIHLPMILCFEAQLGYKGLKALILSKNLSSALVNTKIIDNKVADDLKNYKIEEVLNPTLLFISSPLGLVSKHDGG